MKPTILVPFDFSAAAESALAWAADLHKTTGAGPIQIVHAINSHPVGYRRGEPGGPSAQ